LHHAAQLFDSFHHGHNVKAFQALAHLNVKAFQALAHLDLQTFTAIAGRQTIGTEKAQYQEELIVSDLKTKNCLSLRYQTVLGEAWRTHE
jgi:hypothetical protein